MSRKVLLLLCLLFCLFRAYSTESSGEITSKYPLPSILNEQALTVVVQGRTVVLKCRTTCDCPQKDDIKVSWLDNGHKVSIDSRTQVSKAGELSIRNVTSRSVGKRVFKCVASIGNWSVIGVERRVKVIDPTSQSVILQPTQQTLPNSGHASLRCKVDAILNLSKSTMSWYKDGALLLLSNDTKYTRLPDGVLVIHSLRRKDAGSYSCKVYSSLLRRNLVSNSANLTIVMGEVRLKLPYFTHRPKDIEILERKTTAIHCSASGNPIPIVTISRERGYMLYVDLAKGVGFANLTLRNAKMNNTGKYVCSVKSGEIKLQHPVWIKVLSPPKFTSVPEPRKLTLKGVNLSLSCVATGRPTPVITWHKNGKPLPMADNDIAEGKGTITIASQSKNDIGIYQCFAMNKVGSVSHATFVFMETAVRPPVNINAVATTHSRVKVTWQLNPLNNIAAVLTHIVSYEYHTSSSQSSRKTKVMSTAEITDSEIGPLLGGTEYSVYVTTYGMIGGKSTRSEVIKVKTLENVPSIPPQPIDVQNLGNKTMRVSWTPIPRKFAMGTVIRYKVKYGIAGIENKEILIPMGKTHVNISNLQIGELYTIEVSAETSAGFGPAEKTTIKIGDPGIAARNGPPVEFTTVNSTSIRAHWKLKEDQNDITGFKLVCIPIRYADYWHEARIISLPPTTNEYIISGLNPEKDYRIELRIISGPVLSKPSIVVYTRHRRKPIPGDLKLLDVSNPRELKCAAKGKRSLFLSWEKPLKNRDINDYSVIIVVGGKKIKDYTPFRTKNLDYVLKDLRPGTWYYIKVDANPRRDRLTKVQEQLKRAVTAKFESNVVACKTAESAPGPPTKLYCNVTKDGHKAKVTWYPPMYPNGLITNYVIRYRVRSKKYKTKWTIDTLKMKPNNKGFPLEQQLKGDYYKTYEIEVLAVNSAGVGKSAKIETCALKRSIERPLPSGVTTKKPKKGDDIMSNDTILGIIVGCSIASLFIFTFIGVFIWKNPFRVKSLESQKTDANKANENGMYAEDYLYLQRLAELRNSLTQEGSECSTRCAATPSGSNGRASGDKDMTGASEPLMARYHQTVMELTGSSSGQAVCTCTCLLHGRLRGKSLGALEKREYTSTSTSTREDNQNHKNNHTNSSNSSSSGTSEGVDSAESADSRTKMLPKSDASSYVVKDPTACTKAMHQKKKDSKFQV